MKDERIQRKPELLLPAGNLENLKLAIRYGADAVYFGGQRFGLRAKADNFSLEDMREGVRFAHENGAKTYLTVNIYAHNEDIEGLKQYFRELQGIPIDALLISDPGVLMLAKEILPDIPIHISTQANNTNYLTWKFWKAQGAERVVAARELSLAEIKRIKEEIGEEMEIEAFIHGAMCISYSGRCLLSSYFTGRDANRGACTHPCRWKYHLSEGMPEDMTPDYAVMEDSRPGEYFPVEEDERGTYIFSSRDMAMIGHIDDLISAGVDSFKIEGRMKNALYVATVARAYRAAIDECVADPDSYKSHIPLYEDEIRATTYRPFGTGFYYGSPSAEGQIYDTNTYITAYTYLGIIREVDDAGRGFFIQKNKFSVGEKIEVIGPDLRTEEVTVTAITTEDGTFRDSCPHAGERLFVTTDGTLCPGDIIRRRELKEEAL